MKKKIGDASRLVFVLAESALELIPRDLYGHPSVQSYSKRRGKHPRFLFLDRSYHHAAMKNLEGSEKRGRPDIVHFTLLEALGTPLNKEGLLQTYVHTLNDCVITVEPEARLPRNYDRFLGLMEQLFELGRVPPEGSPLLMLERKTLPRLLQEARPDYVMAFSRQGEPRSLEEAILRLSDKERPTVIIGGFPRGQLSETTMGLVNEVVCIDPEMMETWTVTSRVIYEYENAVSLPRKRLSRSRAGSFRAQEW